MNKNKLDLYRETINLLDCIEIAMDDEKKFNFIRKKMLDLANDIKKLDEKNGDAYGN